MHLIVPIWHLFAHGLLRHRDPSEQAVMRIADAHGQRAYALLKLHTVIIRYVKYWRYHVRAHVARGAGTKVRGYPYRLDLSPIEISSVM